MPASTYLLDTHCLIWFQDNNPKIPKQVLSLIENTANTIYFSQISLFEISIKLKINKLPDFTATIEDVYEQAILDGFTFLPIKNQHVFSYQHVPLLLDHRDPFDRLLIATALEEKTTLLSADKHFAGYGRLIDVFWQ
ncbi:MAG: type II toxin-antitoxin system VapC family toxin [Bacteroidota bacterium]